MKQKQVWKHNLLVEWRRRIVNETELKPYIEEIARQVFKEELAKFDAQRIVSDFGVSWLYSSEPSPELISLPSKTSILLNCDDKP